MAHVQWTCTIDRETCGASHNLSAQASLWQNSSSTRLSTVAPDIERIEYVPLTQFCLAPEVSPYYTNTDLIATVAAFCFPGPQLYSLNAALCCSITSFSAQPRSHCIPSFKLPPP